MAHSFRNPMVSILFMILTAGCIPHMPIPPAPGPPPPPGSPDALGYSTGTPLYIEGYQSIWPLAIYCLASVGALALLAVVIGAAILVTRRYLALHLSPEDTVRLRFARGEIDDDEYHRIIQELNSEIQGGKS